MDRCGKRTVRPVCNVELWGCNRRTGMAVHLTRALLADPDILILSDPVVHHTPDEVRSDSSLPRPGLGLPRPPSASLGLSHARMRVRAPVIVARRVGARTNLAID